MTTAHATADRTDEALARAGRWLLAKIWIGCLLSGTYAAGRHFGMPQLAQSILATFGAVMLAMAAFWLPIWTRDRPTGIVVVDVGLRAVVWAGLSAGVVALLIGRPAVGSVAGALLITTAWRTFRDRDAARPPARFRPAASLRRRQGRPRPEPGQGRPAGPAPRRTPDAPKQCPRPARSGSPATDTGNAETLDPGQPVPPGFRSRRVSSGNRATPRRRSGRLSERDTRRSDPR